MHDWLEDELARHLAPVKAPPALTPRPPVQRGFRIAPMLATAAAVALLLLIVPHGEDRRQGVTRVRFERTRIQRDAVASTCGLCHTNL